MATRFRRAFRKLAPSWLTEGEGESVQFSLGVIKDAFVERCRQGLLARFPAHSPEDALAFIGRDRGLIRGFAETADAYRLRLPLWLDAWITAGNAFTLMDQVAAYLSPYEVTIRIVTNTGLWYTRTKTGTHGYNMPTNPKNWDWDGNTASWSRFWLIIYPLTSGIWQDMKWSDLTHWGTPETWGSDATLEQIAAIRLIVSRFKAGGSSCEYIIVAFDPNSFNPIAAAGAPMPAGDWEYNRKPGSDPTNTARLMTARYWKGAA